VDLEVLDFRLIINDMACNQTRVYRKKLKINYGLQICSIEYFDWLGMRNLRITLLQNRKKYGL
jgi:hypothetical protein